VYDLENAMERGKDEPGEGCCCTQGFTIKSFYSKKAPFSDTIVPLLSRRKKSLDFELFE
jgi:hypothetical protein